MTPLPMAANVTSSAVHNQNDKGDRSSEGDDAEPGKHGTNDAFPSKAMDHVEEFTKRTGMTPDNCYKLVLLCLVLRILGWSWVGMVGLEYTRYYVVNDVNIITAIETATASPLCLVKAFLFPVWGRYADQVSRKSVLAMSSVAAAMSMWLLTVLPSIEIFVITRILGMFSDIGAPVNSAMLRDLFSASEWDHQGGGVTGIKSRMAIIGSSSAAFAIAIGMCILKAGELGLGLPNEYTIRREDCFGQKHCVPRGQVSWEEGGWYVDGSLRLLMLMGSIVITIEALVFILFFPETLPKSSKTRTTFPQFLANSWHDNARPWNNLRVFATEQLRSLIVIRFLMYIITSGGAALFTSWYRRYELDTFTMYSLGSAGGVVGFVILFAIKHIVDKFGDLRALWIPSAFFALAYGASIALVPASMWSMFYFIFPLLGGPSVALASFTPELLSKLIPSDIQATFQTGKSFLYDIQKAVFVWPWLGLLLVSEKLPYPCDALPIWVALILGCIVLWLTMWEARRDPATAIREGKALEPFWLTPYAQGPWYRRHKGEQIDPFHRIAKSKAGLYLDRSNDGALEDYLQFMGQQSWKPSSLSMIFYFDDDNVAQDPSKRATSQGV